MRTYKLHTPEPSLELIAQWNSVNNSRKAIDVFTGLALGILADGTINSKEALFLQGWIEANKAELPALLATNLSSKLAALSNSEDLQDCDLAALAEILVDSLGFDSDQVKAEQVGRPSRLLFDNISASDVTFTDAIFVLSGSFEKCSKKEVSSTIEKLGGHPNTNTPNKKTHYVVVGGKGSSQWITSSLGSKIRRALDLKEDGLNIKIISEETFWRPLMLLILEILNVFNSQRSNTSAPSSQSFTLAASDLARFS
ncbi:hypothetical protein Rhal01_00133 [Rubritalea halochordaticola]|uniref:BRCT domain-containing protein n=1 Tax=Rubritalea halochordaticola TaxID=714537 RepID=A0ABP9UU23_9BACT